MFLFNRNAARYIKRNALNTSILVIGFFPALLFKLFHYSFANVKHRRIGHLMSDIYCIVKEKEHNNIRVKYILLCPSGEVANPYILKYLRKYVIIIENPFLCYVLWPLKRHPLTRKDMESYTETHDFGEFINVIKATEGREEPPFFTLIDEDRKKGEKLIRELGVPENSWYVCVHNRGSGYSGGVSKDYEQDFRNCNIDNYKAAMDLIVSHGGYCIRMGDPTLEKLSDKPNIIDYAHHNLRSSFLDIFLSATCRFYLTSGSGLFLVGKLFGVPAACVNIVPMGQVLVWGKDDIGIPKLYERNGQMIPFSDILNTELGKLRTTRQFFSHRVLPIENSSDELYHLTEEMIERLNSGMSIYSDEDETLQQKFKEQMNKMNFTYSGTSRVGRYFLKKHEGLLLKV